MEPKPGMALSFCRVMAWCTCRGCRLLPGSSRRSWKGCRRRASSGPIFAAAGRRSLRLCQYSGRLEAYRPVRLCSRRWHWGCRCGSVPYPGDAQLFVGPQSDEHRILGGAGAEPCFATVDAAGERIVGDGLCNAVIAVVLLVGAVAGRRWSTMARRAGWWSPVSFPGVGCSATRTVWHCRRPVLVPSGFGQAAMSMSCAPAGCW